MENQSEPTPPAAAKWERCLVALLRISAITTGSALFAVFLPRAWMAGIHEWLGAGRFPDGPIVEYLARSLSAFYAMHGVLLWIVSLDVRRFAPVLTFLIWAGIVFGLGLWVIDYLAGLPPQWIVGEGTSVLLLCSAMLFLKTKARV